MMSEEIRDLLRSLPAIAVVEDGVPAYVVMTYEAWKQVNQDQPVRISNNRPGHMESSEKSLADPQEAQILERLNREILSLRNQIQMQEQVVGEGEAPEAKSVDGEVDGE
jgi:hypothetical protein